MTFAVFGSLLRKSNRGSTMISSSSQVAGDDNNTPVFEFTQIIKQL